MLRVLTKTILHAYCCWHACAGAPQALHGHLRKNPCASATAQGPWIYRRSVFYFPGLGTCPVMEFNSRPKCQTHTVLEAMSRSQGFSNETSRLSAGRLPIADARHRFAAGSARRIAKRKQGKNIWGPLPGLCSRAERRFIFYPSSLTSSPHNSRWC